MGATICLYMELKNTQPHFFVEDDVIAQEDMRKMSEEKLKLLSP